MMCKKMLSMVFLLLAMLGRAWAQDENLRLHFDFSQVDGTNVTDVAGGVTARLVGSATVEQMGKYNVLNLGNASGYLNMTSGTGNIVKSLNDFTISAY